jgi:hypothetical protein
LGKPAAELRREGIGSGAVGAVDGDDVGIAQGSHSPRATASAALAALHSSRAW